MISVENATFTYPGAPSPILTNVSFEVPERSLLAILGPNGAGKTTILNLLRGDLEPTSGRVKRGKTVQVATLSQDTHELDALADMRVVEAVADVAQTVVVDGKEVSASQMTERMGFTRARAYTRISEISGGERRRLQLMRLLMSQPNVLLLDEPFTGLDMPTQEMLMDLFRSLADGGRALLMTTHDLIGARAGCDRLYLLRRTIVASGRPDELADADPWIRAFDVRPDNPILDALGVRA